MSKKKKIDMDDIFSTYKDREEGAFQNQKSDTSDAAGKPGGKENVENTNIENNIIEETTVKSDISEEQTRSRKDFHGNAEGERKSFSQIPEKEKLPDDPLVEIRAKVKKSHRSFIENCKITTQIKRADVSNKERITLNSITRAILEAARLLEPDLSNVKDESDLVDRFVAAMRRFGS